MTPREVRQRAAELHARLGGPGGESLRHVEEAMMLLTSETAEDVRTCATTVDRALLAVAANLAEVARLQRVAALARRALEEYERDVCTEASEVFDALRVELAPPEASR